MSRKRREKMKAKERRHAPARPPAEPGASPTASKPPKSTGRSAKNKRKRKTRRWLGLTQTQWLWVVVALAVIAAAAVLIWWFTRGPASERAAATATPAIVAPTTEPTTEPTTTTAREKGERPLAAITPAERVNYYSSPPEMQIDPTKDYTATIHTERGDIVLELYADLVPQTVNNFVFLANEGYYDDTTFHRVITNFMAQAGDPSGTGGGGPGYTFADEFHPDLRHDGPGVLSMANRGTDTNGGQFFITYSAQPHLDDLHAVFGRVVEGMDILQQISPRDPSSATEPGERILSITIEES